MYVEQLEMLGIQEKVNTTRFTESIVQCLPELHIETIDNKARLVFKRKVKQLIGEHVKCPDHFLFTIYLDTKIITVSLPYHYSN